MTKGIGSRQKLLSIVVFAGICITSTGDAAWLLTAPAASPASPCSAWADAVMTKTTRDFVELLTDRLEVHIFLEPNVSNIDAEQVRIKLNSLPQVSRVEFEPQVDAYNRNLRMFPRRTLQFGIHILMSNPQDSVYLNRTLGFTVSSPSDEPESFRAGLRDWRRAQDVIDAVQDLPGVVWVEDYGAILHARTIPGTVKILGTKINSLLQVLSQQRSINVNGKRFNRPDHCAVPPIPAAY